MAHEALDENLGGLKSQVDAVEKRLTAAESRLTAGEDEATQAAVAAALARWLLILVGVAALAVTLWGYGAFGQRTVSPTISTKSTTTIKSTTGDKSTSESSRVTESTIAGSRGGEDSILDTKQNPLSDTAAASLAAVGFLLLLVAAFFDRISKINLPGGGGVELTPPGTTKALIDEVVKKAPEAPTSVASLVVSRAKDQLALKYVGKRRPAKIPQEEISEAVDDALALTQFAGKSYEDLRAEPKSSPRRFERETELVEAVRARASQGGLDAMAPEAFRVAASGDRIVSLAVAQGVLDPGHFEIVIDAIDHPRSRFEQLQALIAADGLDRLEPPELTKDQRREIREAILRKRSAGRDSLVERIEEGTERWEVSERILRRPAP